MLSRIMDHRVAIPKGQGMYLNLYGVIRRTTTTGGWELLVEWHDGLSDWVSLKDLKHLHPVKLAIYAKDRKIDDKPAFAWWVQYVLRNRSKYFRQSSQSTGQGHTNTVFGFQKPSLRQWRLIKSLETPCGWMQYTWRCKMSELP